MSDIKVCLRCGHEHTLTCADLACQMIMIEERLYELEQWTRSQEEDIYTRLKKLEDKKNTNLKWWQKVLKMG